MAKRKTCGDCGTKEGQLHILGCDMEGCPFCGNQLISCQCVYKKLGIDVSPGSWAYSHGLTDAQALGTRIQGQAQASVQGFTGHLRIWKTQIEDAAASLGQKYGPALMVASTGITALGSITV